jgi:glycerol-3-phosphate dehydrogenase
MASPHKVEVEACIIGAGATGLCTASLLANAGIRCVIVEQNAIASGATTHNAGVLHSGARYAVADPETARNCFAASQRLAQFAPYCLTNDSIAHYLISSDEAEMYASQLLSACSLIGIPTDLLDSNEACSGMSVLNRHCVRGAVAVPDRVFDPFLLVSSYVAFLSDAAVPIYCDALILRVEYKTNWRITLQTTDSREKRIIESPNIFVTAGAWSPLLLERFGVRITANYVRGSVFVIGRSLTARIVSLCELPSSGDTLIPCYDATLLGSTWEPQTGPVPLPPSQIECASITKALQPFLLCALEPKIIHSYSAIRVMPTGAGGIVDARGPQGTHIFDHELEHGVPGVMSAFGGKLTTHLDMALAIVDLACARLGCSRIRNLSYLPFRFSHPGRNLGTPAEFRSGRSN